VTSSRSWDPPAREKTTLLNLIGGLDSPTQGIIAVAGRRIDQLNEESLAKWRASNVGFVFQFYNLLPTLSAQKNVELATAADQTTGEAGVGTMPA